MEPSLRCNGWVRGWMAVVLLLTSGALADPHPLAETGKCREVSLPVALSPNGPQDQMIAGTLCEPTIHVQQPREVVVLVHGGTYNRTYWDWPQHPPYYSFARQTLPWGRAVFWYDRPGTGASSRPPSAAVTFSADAHVLHQVVGWLRTEGFARVTTVGHSLGSIISIVEAGTYQDVDRLVVTGILHLLTSLDPAVFYPANVDPQFAGEGYDSGYLTSRPGVRGPIFYYSPGSAPAIVVYDEAHKDVATAAQFAEVPVILLTPPAQNISNRIRAPVLLVMGAQDAIFCETLDCSNPQTIRSAEAPYYANAASFTVKSIPLTGHNLTLHYSAPASALLINHWIHTTAP
jgi:pimeloyl-ACP methyl ester carboxylesterase